MSKVLLRTHNVDADEGADQVFRDSPLTHVAVFFLLKMGVRNIFDFTWRQTVVTGSDAEGTAKAGGVVEAIALIGALDVSEAPAGRGNIGNERLGTVTRRTVTSHFQRSERFTYWILHRIR